jgi:hypothetical protein
MKGCDLSLAIPQQHVPACETIQKKIKRARPVSSADDVVTCSDGDRLALHAAERFLLQDGQATDGFQLPNERSSWRQRRIGLSVPHWSALSSMAGSALCRLQAGALLS